MADWKSSTHCSRWVLTAEEILKRRMSNNERAARRLQQTGCSKLEVLQAAGQSDPPTQDPLSLDEEAVLRRFYEAKLQEVCAAFRFPLKIQATAAHYFKRFFLSFSLMEHTPKSIMLTCIYVACKIDESYVSAEAFGRGIEQDPKLVLDHELTLLQGLDFDLICYGPFRSIEGFIADFQDFQSPNDLPEDALQSLRRHAIAAASSTFLSDAPLLYPPGQIALAALVMANDASKLLPSMSDYLESLSERHGSGHSLEELQRQLADIGSLARDEGQTPPEKISWRIDRKLRLCQDPQLWAEELEKKKTKKEKQKGAKRSAPDLSMTAPVPGAILTSPIDPELSHEAKRRRSANEVLRVSRTEEQ